MGFDDHRNIEDEIDAECDADDAGGWVHRIEKDACTAVRRHLLRTCKALRGQVEVRERMYIALAIATESHKVSDRTLNLVAHYQTTLLECLAHRNQPWLQLGIDSLESSVQSDLERTPSVKCSDCISAQTPKRSPSRGR